MKPNKSSSFRMNTHFGGIKNPASFVRFRSFLDFLRHTFFNTRYVLVSSKENTLNTTVNVYNLSVDKDESYVIPAGIVHNCRCNVVQVLKSKHPATNHDEAMRLGDEALQRDTKGMFRFNPGKEEKSVPDYNPYTIRKCNTCPIAKDNKSGSLAKLAPPDNAVCAACHEIHDIANRFETNRRLYERLCNSPNYHDVEFDPSTGGLKATHINHNFDSKKGWYESIVQEAGFKKGYSVIFTQERHDIFGKKNVEGRWNGFKFEVAAAETAIPNNIRNALKHCASKGAQIAVIVFPMKEMDYEIFNKGLSKYNGLKGTPQYHHFKSIYCVDKSGNIIYTKKPSD